MNKKVKDWQRQPFNWGRKNKRTSKMGDTKDKCKMDRIKDRLVKLHEKIQDQVENIQDQVQTRIEKSKMSKFVSHLSLERSSIDSSISNSLEDKDEATDGEKTSITSSESSDIKFYKSNSIPSVVVDKSPNINRDKKEICNTFLNVERENVLFKRRSISATNLAFDEDTKLKLYDSSSGSCLSCESSSDERFVVLSDFITHIVICIFVSTTGLCLLYHFLLTRRLTRLSITIWRKFEYWLTYFLWIAKVTFFIKMYSFAIL